MSLNDKSKRFLQLAEYLYLKNWVHFKLQDGGWTNALRGEEEVFGIFMRTMICNDSESKKFYNKLGGFKGAKAKFENMKDFEKWLGYELEDLNMGSGKGSHRDNRHKKHTPKGIRTYLEMVGNSQLDFIQEIKTYDRLISTIDSIPSCGPLTAFDLAKRFYESNIVRYLPDRFYLTGTGEVNGIKALFPEATSDEDLIHFGNLLLSRLLSAGIPENIVHYGLEDLLCIFQKDSRYIGFLEGNISVEEFGNNIIGEKCLRERGIGC